MKARSVLIYALLSLIQIGIVLLFVSILKEAIRKGQLGEQRAKEASCLLFSQQGNESLGGFPHPAPDFSLPDSQGKKVSLSSLQGEIILLQFVKKDCPTCEERVERLLKITSRLENASYMLIISGKDSKEQEVYQKKMLSYRSNKMYLLLDPNQEVAHQYGVTSSELYLIDPQGRVRYLLPESQALPSADDIKSCLESLTLSSL